MVSSFQRYCSKKSGPICLIYHIHNSISTVKPSIPTTIRGKDKQEDLLLFYSLSTTLGLLLIVLFIVMAIMCVCCYFYNKRLHTDTNMSKRSKVIARALKQETIGLNVCSISGGFSERSTSSEKMGEVSKCGSCHTETTYTPTSTPESTV